MKAWKKVGITCILAVILLSGYGLPEVINAILDRQVNDNTETVNAETTQLQMSSDLTLMEKFLVMDRTSSSVNLNSAQNMEYEAALECLNQELSELFPVSASDPFSISDFTETEHTITLFVYEEKSVLLWDFSLEDEEGNQLRVLLDDDSSLILSVSYTLGKTQPRTGTSSDLFATISDEKETEPADYLDDLALRYADYLQASYNLNGTEISYDWAWDSIEEWKSDSDADTEQNTDDGDNETDSAATDDEEDSDTGESPIPGATENDSVLDSSGNTQHTDTSISLWNYDASGNTSAASDSEEDTDEEINDWHTYIYFAKNGEEYILELSLTRNALAIHSIE